MWKLRHQRKKYSMVQKKKITLTLEMLLRQKTKSRYNSLKKRERKKEKKKSIFKILMIIPRSQSEQNMYLVTSIVHLFYASIQFGGLKLDNFTKHT